MAAASPRVRAILVGTGQAKAESLACSSRSRHVCAGSLIRVLSVLFVRFLGAPNQTKRARESSKGGGSAEKTWPRARGCIVFVCAVLCSAEADDDDV